MKIWDVIKTGKKVMDSREEFKEAKENGEVSILKELSVGNVAPGATWLMVRGAIVGVVSAILTGVIATADGFVAANLQEMFTQDTINGASVAIVGSFYLWSVLDVLRSSARTGLWSKREDDETDS